MQCQRCHGMMVTEGVWTQQGKVVMARCSSCGNLVDPLVMANRARSQASLALMLEREAQEEKLQESGTPVRQEVSARRRAA
ncbi:MAG: hypothetical protein EPO39_01335 [Candidatus Manganitrophaceae bacterium]|nr:MAG: hypothetical protein EPO39_01335 [Candidatus Manganitrophaceae bacterium]